MRDFSNFRLTTISFGEINIWYSMNQLDLQHPTQRHSVWTIEDGTKFIESVIEHFPFEPVYIVKNREFYSVIDGKQRISTLLYFLGIMEKDAIYQDKSKKKDNLVNYKFSLSYDDLSEDFKKKYKINENEISPLNIDFLIKKIPNLFKIIGSLVFPCYISFEEEKEQGEEENVYELFKRLNSSGVTIENGETILSIIFDKNLDTNRANERIEMFEKAIYKDEKDKHLKRKKIWEIFAKIFFIDKNREQFLGGKKDSENLDEQIEEFAKSMSAEECEENFKKIEELSIKINNLTEDGKFSFFNKTGNIKSKPENFYIYSIILKMIENDVNVEYLKNLKMVVDGIVSKHQSFDIQQEDKETEEIKDVPLISKFNREPKKVSLGLFLASLDLSNFKGQESYGDIRDSIFKKYIKK